MVDSHCHLADEAFSADLDLVVARARAAGVQRALCILAAEDRGEAAAARRVRSVWPEVAFAVGIHPHNAHAFAGRLAEALASVRRGLEEEGARALGEIGLDYHYTFSPPAAQIEAFAAQLDLAATRDLPAIIHTREATEDTMRVIREAGPGRVRGVFHCFTGDRALARRVLDLDFHVSLSGIATFPKSDELRAVAQYVPEDRLLVETDAPYLAPVPYRGKRNEPAFVAEIVKAIAAVRGVGAAELAGVVTRNFDAFLGPTVSLPTA